MNNKLFFYSIILFSCSLFSQENFTSMSLKVCEYSPKTESFECLPSINTETLITINKERTILKIISEDYKYIYFITEEEKEKKEDDVFTTLKLVRNDGVNYTGIFYSNSLFTIIWKDSEGTYATKFRLK